MTPLPTSGRTHINKVKVIKKFPVRVTKIIAYYSASSSLSGSYIAIVVVVLSVWLARPVSSGTRYIAYGFVRKSVL